MSVWNEVPLFQKLFLYPSSETDVTQQPYLLVVVHAKRNRVPG
jgi:hypothetical protein